MKYVYQEPRLVILALLLIVTSGIAGFTTRPRLEDPESSVRWGYITTPLPGASPAEVESFVSEPIEKAVREAKAIRSVESSSLQGVSIVFVRLTDEVVDVEGSWSTIQDKLSEAIGSLPAGAGTPLLVDERGWGSYTTVVALVDKAAEPHEPSVLARWGKELDNRLRFVPGTRFTELYGLPEEEILVELTEETLAATALTIEEVAEKIRLRDAESPDAAAQTARFKLPIRVMGDIDDLDRLRTVTLRGNAEGEQLHLNDVATIRRGETTPANTSAFVDGSRSVVVASRMDTDSHIDSWTAAQMAALEEFEATLPAGLEMRLLFSQKKYTDERSSQLYGSLGIGMLLVIAVVCVMMGWRAALPICSALPLTLLGVFFLMMPFGISLHQMSIAGLILALGMLIDNPIIVVDDIQRRVEHGSGALEALTASIKHLTTPLIGSNLTTILGFAPILLLPGPTGEFLGQLGWAVIACLAVSLVLSLSIIPVLAAWCLRARHVQKEEPGRSTRGYRAVLSAMYERPWTTVGLSVILPLSGFLVAGDLSEQFFPTAERDHFHFTVRLPAHASIRESERVAHKARQIILEHDEVASVSLFAGTHAPMVHYSMLTTDPDRPNLAQGIVQLKTPRVDPSLIRRIQQQLDGRLPEAQVIVTPIEQGPPALAPIQFRLYGPSLDRLTAIGEETRRILATIPGVTHTRTTLDSGGPRIALEVRQHEAEPAGLSDESIARQIHNQLDGVTLTNLSDGMEEIPIRVRLEKADITRPERVFSLPLISPTKQVIPLGSIADWSVDQQLVAIHRRNSSRSNVIYAYVAAGELPIVVENRFKAALERSGFRLPPGYRSDFGGVSQERNAAVGNLLAYATIIGTLMLAVLVLTFRSFRQAGIIGTVGLLSIGLGLLSLWLFGYPIGIVAIIGIMGIMGLAINDSIVVLSDCHAALAREESLATTVSHSTRHVLTTSLTTIAGVSPLIFAGGDFWPPMMIVIAGGVAGATVLALGLTPAMFILLRPKA